jgi:hypothetical protein
MAALRERPMVPSALISRHALRHITRPLIQQEKQKEEDDGRSSRA